MPISEQTYRQVALEDPEGKWELVCGRLRQKPEMTTEHNLIPRALLLQLVDQFDRSQFVAAEGTARLRTSSGSYYIADLCVLRWEAIRRLREVPGTFEVYEDAVPLMVEVWSPSTGIKDLTEKLAEYERRGDEEIWFIHPYERTLRARVRQPDGSYRETLYQRGSVPLAALPGVAIDVDALFQ